MKIILTRSAVPLSIFYKLIFQKRSLNSIYDEPKHAKLPYDLSERKTTRTTRIYEPYLV